MVGRRGRGGSGVTASRGMRGRRRRRRRRRRGWVRGGGLPRPRDRLHRAVRGWRADRHRDPVGGGANECEARSADRGAERRGGRGTVAAGEVANADGDGYTVLMHHIGMSTAPALYPNLAYKPLEDFKTVGLVTTVPMTIVARKDFEPNTLQELVTYVKANADKVSYANAGIGAASQLCGLLIEKEMGVDLTEVPYDGTGPALTDLVGGQVDFMCDQTTNTTGQIKADKVKAYAVTTPERVEALPDLPTTAEAGLEGVEIGVWHGVYVPAET